eukprot:Em0434g1a
MTFSSVAEKDAFKLRVDSARRILFPYESTSQRPDNAALLNAMLDIVLSIQSTTPSTIQSTHSFLDTAGICTGDEDKDDQRLCVVEHKAIRCLCTKNVAKEMKKICAGSVKARDKTWFAQLSDKGVPKYTCTGAEELCQLHLMAPQGFI